MKYPLNSTSLEIFESITGFGGSGTGSTFGGGRLAPGLKKGLLASLVRQKDTSIKIHTIFLHHLNTYLIFQS